MSRLPLRLRVMAAFGLVTLLVTGLLALLCWNLSASYLLGQREHSAIRQAGVNARLVDATLDHRPQALASLLTGLGSEARSAILVVDRGQRISSSNAVDPDRLPRALLRMVDRGQPAWQRIGLDGVPVVAVGVPLRDGGTYVEVFPLDELDHTFHFLSWMLVLGVVVSGLAGSLLGAWAANRALRPLTTLTGAAAAAAAGDLSVRLPATRDPDLAPLALAFNETAERLQQRSVRDARFASDVSHELRTPLTTMVNALALLRRRRAELPVGARQAVDLLDADLRRFQRLVDDLLEISRTDQQDDRGGYDVVDLAELVGQTVRDRPAAAVLENGAHPLVHADRRRLERVVANLVDNAERHGDGLVRLAVVRAEGRARIEVDDAGPGVPVTDREHIFERFARGAPGDREATSGAGLGLALVARHVGHHDGRAWVEDRPGGGARFVVELPEVSR